MSTKKMRLTAEGKVKLPLTCALVAYSIVVSSWTGMIVVIAMLMSFCGDIYMLKHGDCFHNKGKDDFVAGVFMFMISHILYANLMTTPINEIIVLFMTAIAMLYATAVALGVKSKVAIISFYVAILLLSVVNTFNFNKVAFVGGLLFLISDACIGIFDLLKNRSFLRHLLVWGTYVPAQILLLTSFTI